MMTDRLSGAFFFLFGLALYFHVIPNFVDEMDYGAIHPDTVPNALAILLSVCGALLIVKPTAQRTPDWRLVLRAALFFLVLVVGTYAMSWFGFAYVASPLALIIMLLIGERRPGWIVGGVVGLPVVIWLIVKIGLERNLP